VQPNVLPWIIGVWIALGVIWLMGAALTKRAVRVQTRSSRLFQAGLSTIGFLFLLQRYMSVGALGERFLPESAAAAYAGLSITICGAVLAVSARLFLGKNWSATVTIKQDHEIVRRGPYAFVRHPIYSGFLLSALGTALAIGEVRELLGLGFVYLGFWLKLRTEEAFLVEQFGAEYTQYQRETKALIPFVL
jgi:protein-S-isoprenylcysteine O-methyltransferase